MFRYYILTVQSPANPLMWKIINKDYCTGLYVSPLVSRIFQPSGGVGVQSSNPVAVEANQTPTHCGKITAVDGYSGCSCRVDAQALCSYIFAVEIQRRVHMIKNFHKDRRISLLHTVDASESQLISLRFGSW